jgi:hypothetical protein
MVSQRRARIGIGVGLALGAASLAAIDGCSSILGIGDLPIDAGADATAMRDQGAPDTGACVPACSGTTPYCLDHACVACKPSSVGCNAAGAPQECNSGGTWVPAPACGTSTPYCLSGACVQCLPSKDPPVCLPDGGLQFCDDAGLFAFNACTCTNNECQQWPTGKLGDCHYDAGTYTRYDPGVVLDCKSLEIDHGATVAFVTNPEGGALDAAGAWTVIGVVGDAVINGSITSQEDSLGHDMTLKVQVPSADGGPGEVLVYTYVQAEGGAGGSAGWTCAGNLAEGGAPHMGNGGGGGGGGLYVAVNENPPGSMSCPTTCAPVTGGEAGQPATQWMGGAGGYCPDVPAEGGAGAVVYGATGGSGAYGYPGIEYEGSGAGGGSRGRHGGLVYMRVLGTLSGEGGVDLSGQAGGPGGVGVPWGIAFIFSGGSCGSGVDTFYNTTGGGSGGGGAGGAGGAFVLRYQGDASAFLSQVNVSAGGGGYQSVIGGNGDHQPGANGAPGLIEAGPVLP